MKRHTLLGTLGFGILALAAHQASAQSQRQCGRRPMVLERLAKGFGEARQSIGLAANGSVIETFASDETGTWTITVTSPQGVTCLVAAGRSFEAVAEALPPKGDDA